MTEYAVTTRAIKNSGDFLIHKRAVEFICKIKGISKEDLLVVKGYDRLPIEKINKTKALIICGGPALEERFFPDVYPLTNNLSDIEVPMFMFGVGAGFGKTSPDKLRLTIQSRYAIRQFKAVSVRDPISSKFLDSYGINNMVTGCPVYFHPGWDGKVHLPKGRPRVLFTTGPMLMDKKLATHQRTVLKRIKAKFKKVGIGYHRGPARGLDTKGCDVINVTASADKIERYKSFDIHIGYRVHAHIWFISMGRPSFLIPMDTRGLGACQLLNLPFNKLWKSMLPKYIIDMVLKESEKWNMFRTLPYKLRSLEKSAQDFISKIP